MRLLIAALTAALTGGCTSNAQTPPEQNQARQSPEVQKTQRPRETPQREKSMAASLCDKLGEPIIGMTPKQASASCWGNPETQTVSITAERKREVWNYRKGTLNFIDGKLTEIRKSH
jgi:hypothetical protein